MEDAQRREILRKHAPKSLEASEMQAAEKLRDSLRKDLKPYLSQLTSEQELFLLSSIATFQKTLVGSSRDYFARAETIRGVLQLAFSRRPKRELEAMHKKAAEELAAGLERNGALASKDQLDVEGVCKMAASVFWKHLVSGKV